MPASCKHSRHTRPGRVVERSFLFCWDQPWLRLECSRTKGLAMGASAHGLGTVALATSDPDAFPYSALAFVLVGTATTVFLQVPLIRTFLVKLF